MHMIEYSRQPKQMQLGNWHGLSLIRVIVSWKFQKTEA